MIRIILLLIWAGSVLPSDAQQTLFAISQSFLSDALNLLPLARPYIKNISLIDEIELGEGVIARRITISNISVVDFHEGRTRILYSHNSIKIDVSGLTFEIALTVTGRWLGTYDIIVKSSGLSLCVDVGISVKQGIPTFTVRSLKEAPNRLEHNLEVEMTGVLGWMVAQLVGIFGDTIGSQIDSALLSAVESVNAVLHESKTMIPLPPPFNVAKIDWSGIVVNVTEAEYMMIAAQSLIKDIIDVQQSTAAFLETQVPESGDIVLQLSTQRVMQALRVFATRGLISASLPREYVTSDTLANLVPGLAVRNDTDFVVQVTLLKEGYDLVARDNLMNVTLPIQVEIKEEGNALPILSLETMPKVSFGMGLHIGENLSSDNFVLDLASPVGAVANVSVAHLSNSFRVGVSDVGSLDEMKVSALSTALDVLAAGIMDISPLLVPVGHIDLATPSMYMGYGFTIPSFIIRPWKLLKSIRIKFQGDVVECKIDVDWNAGVAVSDKVAGDDEPAALDSKARKETISHDDL